jgi:hypothetical protein
VLLWHRRSAKEKKASYQRQNHRHRKLLEQAVIHRRTEDWVLEQALPTESYQELEPDSEPKPEPELEPRPGLGHEEEQDQEREQEPNEEPVSTSMHDDGTGVGFSHRVDGSPAEPQVGLRSQRLESGGRNANSQTKREEVKIEIDRDSALRVLCVTWNLNGKIPDEDLGKSDAQGHCTDSGLAVPVYFECLRMREYTAIFFSVINLLISLMVSWQHANSPATTER